MMKVVVVVVVKIYIIVIRRVCGQTLARVRVSQTYISIIIISLQWMEIGT